MNIIGIRWKNGKLKQTIPTIKNEIKNLSLKMQIEILSGNASKIDIEIIKEMFKKIEVLVDIFLKNNDKLSDNLNRAIDELENIDKAIIAFEKQNEQITINNNEIPKKDNNIFNINKNIAEEKKETLYKKSLDETDVAIIQKAYIAGQMTLEVLNESYKEKATDIILEYIKTGDASSFLNEGEIYNPRELIVNIDINELKISLIKLINQANRLTFGRTRRLYFGVEAEKHYKSLQNWIESESLSYIPDYETMLELFEKFPNNSEKIFDKLCDEQMGRFSWFIDDCFEICFHTNYIRNCFNMNKLDTCNYLSEIHELLSSCDYEPYRIEHTIKENFYEIVKNKNDIKSKPFA